MNSTHETAITSQTHRIPSPAEGQSMTQRALRIIDDVASYFFPITLVTAEAGTTPTLER